jgi:hypothetical protein
MRICSTQSTGRRDKQHSARKERVRGGAGRGRHNKRLCGGTCRPGRRRHPPAHPPKHPARRTQPADRPPTLCSSAKRLSCGTPCSRTRRSRISCSAHTQEGQAGWQGGRMAGLAVRRRVRLEGRVQFGGRVRRSVRGWAASQPAARKCPGSAGQAEARAASGGVQGKCTGAVDSPLPGSWSTAGTSTMRSPLPAASPGPAAPSAAAGAAPAAPAAAPSAGRGA